LFAIHQIARPQLVFLDAASQTWQPFWEGYAAYEMDFSRDARSVTYVRYPEHTLWKAKADGSEKLQLTHREFEVHQPHWSPDGKCIAFMGRKKDGPWLVFVVSPDGGTPEALLPSGADQGVPTWSPDGKSAIFGDRLYVKLGQHMNVHRLDVASRRLTDVPNSHGMWSPRWSPDGKRILALSSNSEVLYTLVWPGVEWKQAARLYFIDNATWSADSQFIYFNGRTVAGHPMELFRLAIAPGAVPEKLADLKDFAWAPENWFGIAPTGVPLALRDASAEEIFAIDYVLR
jgi:Tol biopolymer transport system component